MARQPITRSQPMPRRKAPSFKSGAIVRCESSQEEEAVARFEACPSVTKITAQPVRITYMHEGKQRRTTPDFKLTLDDGLEIYVEVKHTTQAMTMADVLEARAVGSAAQGLDYYVITDRWIRVEPLLENIRILQRWRGAAQVMFIGAGIAVLIGIALGYSAATSSWQVNWGVGFFMFMLLSPFMLFFGIAGLVMHRFIPRMQESWFR